MEKMILEFIAANGSATFSELERAIPGFSGEGNLTADGYPMVVLWERVSPAGGAALRALLDAKRVRFRAVEPMAYLFEGHQSDLPVIEQPSHELKALSWLPVELQLRDGT